MRRFLLIVILCAQSFSGFAQATYDSVMFPYNEPPFKWLSVEKKDDRLKELFIKNYPKKFNRPFQLYEKGGKDLSTGVSFKNTLHVLDFNGDGLNDILYEGRRGGDTYCILVFLSAKTGFKNVFYDLQHVVKVELRNNHVWRLYTCNPGCCADYMVFNKIFEFDKMYPHFFKEIFSTAYFNTTELPKAFLDNPLKITVLKDSCKLSTHPKVAPNDTLRMFGSNMHVGNDAARITKNANGRAIAKKTDKFGNKWWLVEMDLKAKLSGNVFYNELADNDLSGKMGWIEDKDVKIIN